MAVAVAVEWVAACTNSAIGRMPNHGNRATKARDSKRVFVVFFVSIEVAVRRSARVFRLIARRGSACSLLLVSFMALSCSADGDTEIDTGGATPLVRMTPIPLGFWGRPQLVASVPLDAWAENSDAQTAPPESVRIEFQYKDFFTVLFVADTEWFSARRAPFEQYSVVVPTEDFVRLVDASHVQIKFDDDGAEYVIDPEYLPRFRRFAEQAGLVRTHLGTKPR